MKADPIVEEVREARARLLARFNDDIDALVRHLQEETEKAAQSGHRVVSFPPKRIGPSKPPAKKAG